MLINRLGFGDDIGAKIRRERRYIVGDGAAHVDSPLGWRVGLATALAVGDAWARVRGEVR